MKKGISFFILLLLFGTTLAQGDTAEKENVAVSDAFVGTVTYSIYWKGPNTALWASQLPDSMQVTVHDGNLQVRIYGGVSDSLINEYIWLKSPGQFFILDHRNSVVLTNAPEISPVKLKKQALESSANAREILGYPCEAFQFSGNGNPDKYWISSGLPVAIGELPDSVFSPPFIDPDLQFVPLRMERNVNGVQVITEAIRIEQGAEPIAVPAAYTEKSFFKYAGRHPYFPEKSK